MLYSQNLQKHPPPPIFSNWGARAWPPGPPPPFGLQKSKRVLWSQHFQNYILKTIQTGGRALDPPLIKAFDNV